MRGWAAQWLLWVWSVFGKHTHTLFEWGWRLWPRLIWNLNIWELPFLQLLHGESHSILLHLGAPIRDQSEFEFGRISGPPRFRHTLLVCRLCGCMKAAWWAFAFTSRSLYCYSCNGAPLWPYALLRVVRLSETLGSKALFLWLILISSYA